MKRRLSSVVVLASLILLGGTLSVFGFFSASFSPNQELALPALSPIGPTGVAFINRALEPSIRVSPAPDNTVYVSSIRGVPTGVDLWRSYAPIDGGPNGDGTYNFKYEGKPDGCGLAAFGCSFLGLAEGGGDVDIAVNYPASGVPNLALVSLTLAPGITGTHSTDRGDTFSQPNPAVGLIPGDDRQWIEGTDASTVYLNYHDVGTFNIDVQRSNDGGSTYGNGLGEGIDPQTFPVAGGVPASNSANVAGQIRADRSSCSSRGNLYAIFAAPDNVTENLTGGPLRSIYVGASTDAKLGLPAFTFTDTKVFTGPAGPHNEGAVNLFPALATDNFGFVYAVWSDNTNILYSFSADQGSTWSTVVQVNSGVTNGNSNVFPWVAADANGHVGIVWFGGDRAGNSNDASIHAPCPVTSSSTCMTGWTNWSVYYAETVNGHDSAPAFTQTVASDHVVHRGTISTGGLGGGANRNLGDLFQVAFDAQHRANMAFSDDHAVDTQVGPNNGPDNPTTRRKIRAYFTHQLTANPDLVASGSCSSSPPPPPLGSTKMTGGGQVTSQSPTQSANFGFVANSNKPNASLSYHDDGAAGGSIDVHSTNTSVPQMTFSGNCATFKGDARVNQKPGYSYTVNACDNAEPGAGKDTFFISVTGLNFSYSSGGPITSGNIQSHSQ